MNPTEPLERNPLRSFVSRTPCLKSSIRSSMFWLVFLSKVKATLTSLQGEPSNTCHRHAEGCGILAGQGLEFVWRCTKYKTRLHTYGSGAVDQKINPKCLRVEQRFRVVYLKEQSQEDYSVSGQFCGKIITLRL